MNTLVTPKWIIEDALKRMEAHRPIIGETITIRLPSRFTVPRLSEPLNGKVLLALGAAAVIANPTPVSRRSLLGLNFFGRRNRADLAPAPQDGAGA